MSGRAALGSVRSTRVSRFKVGLRGCCAAGGVGDRSIPAIEPLYADGRPPDIPRHGYCEPVPCRHDPPLTLSGGS